MIYSSDTCTHIYLMYVIVDGAYLNPQYRQGILLLTVVLVVVVGERGQRSSQTNYTMIKNNY